MAKIHPTAIVHPTAVLHDEVEIGAYSIVEADVVIGPGTILRDHATLRRYTTLGRNNLVDSHAVLGGVPQDLKFDPQTVSYLRVGDENVFREGVTISRATREGKVTLVGNRTYWMATAHAGHDAIVEDDAILVNGAALAGHTVLGRGAILSAHVAVHQFCWVDEKAMGQGNSATSMHIPPFTLFAGVNRVVSLNVVGLRRSKEMTREDRRQVKEAFDLTYRRGLTVSEALRAMDEQTGWGEAASRFRDFVRRVVSSQSSCRRGLCPLRREIPFQSNDACQNDSQSIKLRPFQNENREGDPAPFALGVSAEI
ncbi:MAG TPA: acyl-ACP--UDP-N-acetylglucosamine O-acyltransferase [Thermodesulfobacteriota bacterium]|nr:acyl-ACP--UDP-N-acetylglucosamine O-acyltransferase [Thermodesulfobacteriota bacterium]